VSKHEAEEYASHVGDVVSVPPLGSLFVQEVCMNERNDVDFLTFFATSQRDIARHVLCSK
jgi:hypothetical protein